MTRYNHIEKLFGLVLTTIIFATALGGCGEGNSTGPDPELLPEYEIVMIDPPDTLPCYPELRAGDCDFRSRGPEVEVWAELEIRDDGHQLWLILEMAATAVGDDDSDGWGKIDQLLYEAPAGKRIVDIQSESQAQIGYTDDDIFYDSFDTGLGSLTIKGDTLLDDLCGPAIGRSRADIDLHDIWIRLEW